MLIKLKSITKCIIIIYLRKKDKIESKIKKLKVVAVLFGLTSTLGLFVT